MKRMALPYKRKDRPGWWVRFTDPATGKRPAEKFPNKQLAFLYAARINQQLNSHVFTGDIAISLKDAGWEYLKKYDLRGLSRTSKVAAESTLQKLMDYFGAGAEVCRITQTGMDSFVESLQQKGYSPWTINSRLGAVNAFLNWCRHPNRRYITREIEIVKIKTSPLRPKCLTDDQICRLLKACPSLCWQVRILVSLCTGLRKNDVESLRTDELDLKAMAIGYAARKTGKQGRAPLPHKLKPLFRQYLKTLTEQRLFPDKNVRKMWDSIIKKAKVKCTRQDFRRTFATLIQRTGGLASARDLLQHSDGRITDQFYTDRELILRWRVEQLPVKKWLKGV